MTLTVPEGWKLEPVERQEKQHVVISTPGPVVNFATLDFRLRGFRSGFTTTGFLVGEAWNKKPKKYTGRGWQQKLADDAVAWLKTILKEQLSR